MLNNLPLLIGYGNEGTFAHLVSQVTETQSSASVFDLRRIDNCERLIFEHSPEGPRILIDDDVVALGGRPIFYRGFYRPSIDDKRSELLKSFLYELESTIQSAPADQLVMNRPLAGISNASKARHLVELAECGLRVPRTLVSSCPEKIEGRIAPNQRWVNKGCSGLRTIAVAVSGYEASRFDTLRNCPSLFQQHIRGFDVRAHITTHGYVALKICSDRVDYRYARRQGGNISVESISLPTLIHFKAIEFMQRSGLTFSGFDFKVEDNGEWWVLEANPMPGFEFFDQFADCTIAKLVLSTLSAESRAFGRPKASKSGTFISLDRVPAVDKAHLSKSC